MPKTHGSPYKAPLAAPVAERESARPSGDLRFDREADVVVVGSGAGGLASALFSRWQGNDVVLLEKAPELGGTSFKSGFIYWIPNNGPLRELGIEDREEDFLNYVARISRPEKFDPESPTLGQSEWEFGMYKAFYESAWPAVELLDERGALPFRHTTEWIDYWADLPQDATPRGRTFAVAGSDDIVGDGGKLAIEAMSRAAGKDGVEIRAGHRVQRLVVRDGAVVGVVATTAEGEGFAVGARKGVIFATGGFTHDKELRENFLSVPIVHGCAALTNEGDFVRIGAAAGAQLRNMQYGWFAAANLQRALDAAPEFQVSFFTAGDSMICVNYHGRRALNEKLPYNELAHSMNAWDPINSEYPNRVMIQIWDQHAQAGSEREFYGSAIVPPEAGHDHLVKADTLAELAEKVSAWLREVSAHTGNVALSDEFLPNLEATIARWNEMAANGVDEDFHRGGHEIEHGQFGGPVAAEPEKKNSVMWPISDTGPYYATLLVPGALDTKGGPKTNTSGQVVDDLDQPIPGLYGVGNCVASATARAYWAAGGTIGPALAFAYRAAEAIDREPSRDLSAGAGEAVIGE